jgi:hypothetical protein
VAPTIADGVYDYNGKLTVNQTAEAISVLESWGMKNHLTGIPVADDGGLVVKSDRVTFPTTTYVANFGFGAGRGTVSSPLTAAQEPVTGWQSYFHAWTSDNGGTANDMDDDGSASSDLRAMFAATYYNQRLTSDKESYEWYPLLASAEPIPLTSKGGTEDSTLAASKFYRFKVNFGGNYKYSTLSSTYSSYNGQAIALDDYLTPVKAMLQNGWYRKADMAKQFAGVTSYLADYGANPATADWSQVGFQTNADKGSVDVEFVNAKSAFNAKYAISDTLYSPFPAAWLASVGAANAFKIGTSTTNFYNNVDNLISTGIYAPEYWESGKAIVFKKNPTFIEASSYHYDGYKEEIIASTDSTPADTAAFAKWQAGSLDYTGVPSDNISQYVNDSHTLHTLGSVVENIQIDSCTADEWQKYYGPNGTVYPHKADYKDYTVKPILSNDTFLDGLYFAMNRQDFANSQGSNPAQAYLSDAYIVDNATGLAYRKTAAGKSVIADRSPATFGYNQELAIQLFKKAATDEIAAGHYKLGDSITLTIEWRTAGEMKLISSYFKSYIETAWNKAATGLGLTINNVNPSTDYRVAYYDMLQGQCDAMFGAIQGSALDPLNFMDTLCTDGRDLTLSRGADTSIPDSSIVFDGKYWSYDALYSSTQGATIVQQGKEAPALSASTVAPSYNPTDKTLTLKYNYVVSDQLTDFEIAQVYVDMTDATGGSVYDFEGYYDTTGGSIDLGTNGTYSDGTPDVNGAVMALDGKGVMTITLDLSNYVGDSRFDPTGKTIWFQLKWTAVLSGTALSGKVSYSSYAAPAFFGRA